MLSPLKQDKTLLFILILTILGFIIRLYSLTTQSLWIDEGFSINAALATLKHGYPILESGVHYTGIILHTYLTALFIFLFKNDIFGARLLSVIFGTLTIPLTYYLGKEFVNKKTGLIAAVLVTFSIWEIAWSRQARMYTQFQFFYLLSIFFFYKFIKNNNVKTLTYTILFTFLTVLSHSLGYSLFIIYFIYLLIYREYFKVIWKKIFKIKKAYIILLPLFVYVLYRIMPTLLNLNNIIKANYLIPYLYYMKTVNPVFFYLGVIGCFLILKRNLKSGFLLILSFIIPFLSISYFTYLLHYRYLFVIFPILFILTSNTIDYIALLFKKKNLITFIIFILLIGTLLNGFVFIPQKEYDLEKQTPQPNFEKAYNYIKENIKDEVIIDAYPSMGQLYLDRVDYGLKFSLSGRKSLIKNKTTDWYTNIPYINLETLESLDHCYLIIDKLAYRRIDSEIRKFINNNMTLIEEASETKNIWSGITVYKCRNF